MKAGTHIQCAQSWNVIFERSWSMKRISVLFVNDFLYALPFLLFRRFSFDPWLVMVEARSFSVFFSRIFWAFSSSRHINFSDQQSMKKNVGMYRDHLGVKGRRCERRGVAFPARKIPLSRPGRHEHVWESSRFLQRSHASTLASSPCATHPFSASPRTTNNGADLSSEVNNPKASAIAPESTLNRWPNSSSNSTASAKSSAKRVSIACTPGRGAGWGVMVALEWGLNKHEACWTCYVMASRIV